MTTPLPSRLRASAQAMRGLFLVSENVPNVRMIYKEDRDRIAAELTEAADALEAGRVLAEFAKTAPGRLPQRVQDAVALVAQVAQEGGGGKDTKLRTPRMLTSEELAECCGGCRTNSAVETWMQRAIAKFCEVNGITFPRGVPASEYLAKIKADPRRAAALQRARDRAAGVLADGKENQHG